ncbi:MAG: hypothetical protein JSR67_04705 [Proteobacteria bacterium]|nr:hypothetical protein [Pseudomonadota bacterium]
MPELPRTDGPKSTPGSHWPKLPEDDESLAALAAPFVYVRPDAPWHVDIYGHNGSIWAEPNGGSMRVNAGTPLHFTGPVPFTLTFVQLGGTREPIPDAVAKGSGNRWEARVEPLKCGPLAPFYKYTITTADGLQLDPIVIVDK